MQAYTGFAYVYDEYMDNIPYEEWCEYLVERLKEQGVTPDMEIADLGCGTGTVTQLLDKAGYSCVGIDNAPDMLTIAAEKRFIFSGMSLRKIRMRKTVTILPLSGITTMMRKHAITNMTLRCLSKMKMKALSVTRKIISSMDFIWKKYWKRQKRQAWKLKPSMMHLQPMHRRKTVRGYTTY